MGLVGFYVAAKGLDKAFSSGGGGGYYNSQYEREKRDAEIAKARAKELGHVRKAMEAVHGYEVTDGVEVPARVRNGVQRLFISKKRDIKHRSIIVLKADPNGVQMSETGVDLNKYSVVGVIDGKTLCLLEKDTGDMLMVEMSADFDCGPHGDYNSETYPICDGEKHLHEGGYNLRATHITFTRVKATGEVIEHAKAPEEFSALAAETKERYPYGSDIISFGSAICDGVQTFKAKQAAEAKAQAEAKQKQ